MFGKIGIDLLVLPFLKFQTNFGLIQGILGLVEHAFMSVFIEFTLNYKNSQPLYYLVKSIFFLIHYKFGLLVQKDHFTNTPSNPFNLNKIN